jgi:AcrR family transcriptional regulator
MEDVARAAGVTRLIVYRIFETKEVLYRAVLEQVTGRLAQEFAEVTEAFDPARQRGRAARALLRVAREDPDAFRLLWVHAAHEPPFAGYFRQFRAVADAMADELIAPIIDDPVVRHWAAPTLVAHLYDGVIGWLDRGDEARDEDFVTFASVGARALVSAWAVSDRRGRPARARGARRRP